MLSSKEKKALRDKKYYENNKLKIEEQKKVYNELNKEKIAAQKKEYNLKNKEHLDIKRAEYRARNKEKIDEYNSRPESIEKARLREISRRNKEDYKLKKSIKDKKYRDKPSVKIKAKQYNHEYYHTESGRAVKQNIAHKRRLKMSDGDVTKDQLIALKNQSTNCYWCNSKIAKGKENIDHYVPIAQGGKHTISNLVISCAKCNNHKRAKDPIEFANSIGKLL